jgi:hypothetical protein
MFPKGLLMRRFRLQRHGALGAAQLGFRCAALSTLLAILVAPRATASDSARPILPPAPPPERLTFELDVMPVLTAAGCNQGACHGKQRGQNGFQLSLLGFDADFDYTALVHAARGRRLSRSAPAASLLLQKATAQIPHGGGPRLERDGPRYEILRRWISAGMPRSTSSDPVLQRIELLPDETPLERTTRQALTVVAHYSDGSQRDVTGLTTFQSNEPAIVAVDEQGVLEAGSIAGEASIMARFLTEIATWNTGVAVEGSVDPADYEGLPRRNFIDELVWDKLRDMRLLPSPPCDDSTFLRRTHLNLIGRLPSAQEARDFLADQSPDKRARLVDRLLERPEYADFWAAKWADLLRPNPYRVGIKATLNLDVWLRDVFRQNLPYDHWVRQLVAAQGSTWRNGAVTFFRDRREPDEIATAVSQLFLGVRLECAKCHHHPFEIWGQDDFYQFASYFSRIGRKGVGLSPPISGGEEIVFVSASGTVSHPVTGQALEPRPLGSDEGVEIPAGADPRDALVDWMVAPENPFFARAAANRLWAAMMGRGLVEPVDDMRLTNPPSNAALLDALADEFRRVGFDQKALLRVIANSHVYQLASLPNDRNTADTRNYARYYRRQLAAETLLDAVCDVTGGSERFVGARAIAAPLDTRAAGLWTFRLNSRFLDAFGRPDANQDPPCERLGESTVVQALHLMNAPELHAKVVSDTGRAAALAASDRTAEEIITELYLAAYSRYPDVENLAALLGDSPEERRHGTEDVLWSIINSPEFMLCH